MSGARGVAGVVAGVGCRAECPAEAIVAVVQRAETEAGCRVGRLALPMFRRDAAGVAGAVAALGLDVAWVERDALMAVQPRCATYSDAALRAVGVGSVAEGCALAAAGLDAVLLLPRIGMGAATCALAWVP